EAHTIVFRNAAQGGISVVYRRPDGYIVLIDPERNGRRTNTVGAGSSQPQGLQ
ncbi:MAG: sigma 54 modulation/S30EA ribosomal C-terminal domain-containing protein, partial [Phenylobacterium sp.]